MRLEDSGNQIVVVRFGDFAGVEPTGRKRLVLTKIVDEHLAVYFRRMHCAAAFPKKFRLTGRTLNEQFEPFPDKLLLAFAADVLLHSHQLFAPSLDFCRGNFFFQEKGSSTLLIGIPEDAHPVKLGGPNKIAELLKFRLSLTREPDDERRSQREVRDRRAHFLDALEEYLGSPAPLHSLQRRPGCMLQRH